MTSGVTRPGRAQVCPGRRPREPPPTHFLAACAIVIVANGRGGRSPGSQKHRLRRRWGLRPQAAAGPPSRLLGEGGAAAGRVLQGAASPTAMGCGAGGRGRLLLTVAAVLTLLTRPPGEDPQEPPDPTRAPSTRRPSLSLSLSLCLCISVSLSVCVSLSPSVSASFSPPARPRPHQLPRPPSSRPALTRPPPCPQAPGAPGSSAATR